LHVIVVFEEQESVVLEASACVAAFHSARACSKHCVMSRSMNMNIHMHAQWTGCITSVHTRLEHRADYS
jgi:hypothetical protein